VEIPFMPSFATFWLGCRAPLIALCLLLAACGGSRRMLKETAALYEPDVARAQSRASTIVFVPGIMGSQLYDTSDGQPVWGTFWSGGAWEDTLEKMALPFAIDQPVSALEDSIVPGGELLVAELALQSGAIRARGYPGLFEGLVQELTKAGAHHTPTALSIEDAVEGRDPILGFGYDWRREITSEVQRLHEVVVAASRQRQLRTGNPRIDIIAHSMGNLLVRWYLRYGTAPVPDDDSLPEVTWAGVQYVERVLLVAPPNMGEARALEVLLRGAEQHPLLPVYPPAVVATFPSAYQLLPRVEDARVVYADTGEPVDIYDVKVWEGFGWGPFAKDQDDELRLLMPGVETREERLALLRRHMVACFAHARRFHRALDVPEHPPPELRMHAFAGDALPTLAVLRVNRRTGAIDWGDPEPGDGTLTRTSALGQSRADLEAPPVFHPHSVHFNRSDHLQMVGDRAFLDQALYLLLEETDPPAPATPAAPVSIPEQE